MNKLTIQCGDALDVLSRIRDKSFNCCVTSPPYFGLRDYQCEGQIGVEKTPCEYVDRLVTIFREVKRTLRDDGTLWLNLGDSYLSGKGMAGGAKKYAEDTHTVDKKQPARRFGLRAVDCPIPGLKSKDLIGIPWMVAFALREDGWYLRSDIIWEKPNQMPDPTKDRPTRSHEYIFLLSKHKKYYYDTNAVREPAKQAERVRADRFGGNKYNGETTWHSDGSIFNGSVTRNRRTVWSVNTVPFSEAHFATFPEKLVEPCVLAGCPKGGTVVDPFSGAATVGLVALRHDRKFFGIELKPEYVEMSHRRIKEAFPT